MTDAKIAFWFLLWLWPLCLAMVEVLAWFFSIGPFTGIDWTIGKALFGVAWVVMPIRIRHVRSEGHQ